MSRINELIIEKLEQYSDDVRTVILKVLEIASVSKETVISEQLEGIVRDVIK